MTKNLLVIIIKLKNKAHNLLPTKKNINNPPLHRVNSTIHWSLKLKNNKKHNNNLITLFRKNDNKAQPKKHKKISWTAYSNWVFKYKTQQFKLKKKNANMPKKIKKSKNFKYLMLKYILSSTNIRKLHQLINSKANCSQININTAKIPNRDEFRGMLKDCLMFFPFIQLNRVAARLIGALFELLYLKSSQGLARFIQKTFQAVHYKKHNTYFSYIGQLVREILLPQLNKFNCLGVCIIFRGKLGIGGNARKRSLKYRTGMSSASSKFVKINRTFSIIRTKTGTVGFSVLVAW